jgi:xanthine dehydrogenase accessory factor
MTEWIAALAELAAAGRPAVLVTVLRAAGSTPREAGAKMAAGSTPREAGAKMVVTLDGATGTIGGGHLELQILEEARALLARAATGEDVSGPVVRELALGPSLGQCCGGRTAVLLEPVLPVRWSVAVFGAGHVGKALVRLLADLPCAVTWIDPRPEELPTAPPRNVRVVLSETPADEVPDLPAGTDVVVMTHSHALDLEVVEAALRRDDLRYLGLIGSRTKRATFLSRLEARGRTPAQLGRLTCPIGVAGITGKLPAVIAVAVAAELLQVQGRAEAARVAAATVSVPVPEPGG